jgi:hypothetical protein
MDRVLERCAGLDVHKKTVTACVRVPGISGDPSGSATGPFTPWNAKAIASPSNPQPEREDWPTGDFLSNGPSRPFPQGGGGTRPVRVSTMPMRHPSPAARPIRNNPAPTTTAPMARATRSPAGARRSTVMAAATTAIARRSMTPMTSRIAIRPAQQWLQWRPRRRPCRQAVPAAGGSVRPRPGASRQRAR